MQRRNIDLGFMHLRKLEKQKNVLLDNIFLCNFNIHCGFNIFPTKIHQSVLENLIESKPRKTMS